MPGWAHFAGLQAEICFFVSQELLFVRVPNELAVEPNGDVADVAKGVGADGLVNGANSFGAVFHTIDEVAGMKWTADQLDLEIIGIFVDQVFRLEVNSFAIDVNPAVAALKGGAMAGDTVVSLLPFMLLRPGVARGAALVCAIGHADKLHRHSVGELQVDVPNGGCVADSFAVERTAAFHLKGSGKEICAPDGDIDVMNAPTGDETKRIIGFKPPGLFSPVSRTKVLGVGFERSGAEPHVVVQLGRDGDDLS